MKFKRALTLSVSAIILAAAVIMPSGCSGGSNMYVSFKTYTDTNPTKHHEFENTEINVVSNYNDKYDFIMVLKKMGNNDIFNVYSPYMVENVGDKPNSDLEGKTLFMNTDLGVSDWFGPYIVSADNNADGDRKMGEFTGGNHDYLNGSGGSATGRTESITLKVNGKDIKGDYEGYADEIDIYWTNYIQANNTKKEDGSGREVLKEMYHINYKGDNEWHVDQQIEFLEDVTIQTYYGMQAINTAWNEKVKFGDGEWLEGDTTVQSESETENKITLCKSEHYLELNLDTTYGLGKREHMDSLSKTAFVSSYGKNNSKTYYFIVQGSQKFSAGTIDGWKGTYKFYYGEPTATTSEQ